MRKTALIISVLVFLISVIPVFAMEEGTRHITGQNVDVFFMNDKVFGTMNNSPVWAIYNCGTDIKGEIDVKGTYHKFEFVYHKEGDKKITGTFGSTKMALGNIEKKDKKVVYQIFIGEKEYSFSIRYEKIEENHMVNSIIEGDLGPDKKVKLTVDGHLCPFGTTGIILIVCGSLTLV